MPINACDLALAIFFHWHFKMVALQMTKMFSQL